MRGWLAAVVWTAGSICWAGQTAGELPEAVPLADACAAPLLARVTPQGLPSSARSVVELRAARGEVESFFVIVRAPAGARVTAEALALAPARPGASIFPRPVRRVLFVDTPQGRLADAVVPMPQGGAPARGEENLPLLVEVAVPRDAAPGMYSGAVEIRSDGAEIARIPLSLKVLKATLPATASLPTAFGFDARGAWLLHGGDKAKLPELARRYTLAGLEHRVSIVGGSGASPTPRRTAPGEGWLELDFGAFDREVAPFLEGTSELKGARTTAISVRTPAGLSKMEHFKYVLALRRHLREKGWAHALVLVDGQPVFARDRGRASTVVIECDGVTACQRLTGGGPWWRLTAGPGLTEPSLSAGSDPSRIRSIGWHAFELGVAGLRVENVVEGFVDVSVGGAPDPRALFHAPPKGSPPDHPPVESVRLKLLRDGLEDYELLTQASGERRLRIRQLLGEAGAVMPQDDRLDEIREVLDGEEPAHTQLGEALPIKTPAPR